MLIGMLVLIGLTSWKGIETDPRGLQCLDLDFYCPGRADPADRCAGFTPYAGGVTLALTGKFFGVLLS